MNSEPSGVRSETSVNWTLGVVLEYIVTACQEELVMVPLEPPMVAVQLVKVTFPKSASDDKTLLTTGLSTIHSAVSWLEV